MQKHTTKFPGMTWDGRAWSIRVRAISGSLTVSKTKTVKAPNSEPPFAERAALKAVADAELAAKLAGHEAGDRTLSAYARRWIEGLPKRGRTPMYAKTRLSYLDEFILPRLGDREPAGIRPRDLAAFAIWLSEQGRDNGAPYAKGTLLSICATLRSLLSWTVVDADLAVNPTAGFRFEVGGREKTSKHTATLTEIDGIVRALDREAMPDRVLVICGFGLGLRFSELTALEWGDLNLEEGTGEIKRSQVSGKVGPPKTEASRRELYIAPEIVALLREYRAWQMKQQVTGLARGLLFPATAGGYRYPKDTNEVLDRCCARAKVNKHITTHSLRKTRNNQLRQVTSGIVVRAMMGHVTEDMTRLYSNVEKAERADAHRAGFGNVLDVTRRGEG